MDEVKDLEEEKEAARLIFQGPTAEEQLANGGEERKRRLSFSFASGSSCFSRKN
jgi:hypothetical protein